MKMNSLVDRECIAALYRASQAGVRVELNVRGICCLRPGVPGVSENITVNSVVGRFLEHSRIYAFARDGDCKVYIGSADLMPRNLDTRVELLAPVDEPALRGELTDTLDRCLADDTNSWELGEDGSWTRRVPGREPRNAQRELMERHAARAAEAQADLTRNGPARLSPDGAAERRTPSEASALLREAQAHGARAGRHVAGRVLVTVCARTDSLRLLASLSASLGSRRVTFLRSPLRSENARWRPRPARAGCRSSPPWS